MDALITAARCQGGRGRAEIGTELAARPDPLRGKLAILEIPIDFQAV
jgi:hypothetical protein